MLACVSAISNCVLSIAGNSLNQAKFSPKWKLDLMELAAITTTTQHQFMKGFWNSWKAWLVRTRDYLSSKKGDLKRDQISQFQQADYKVPMG